ncbi:lactococcin family bacteriocin [Lactococcus lactis]
MKNQLNFEVVSDEELMIINGGQNMSMTDGGFEWVYAGGKPWFRIV